MRQRRHARAISSASLSYVAGSHDLKLGYQFMRTRVTAAASDLALPVRAARRLPQRRARLGEHLQHADGLLDAEDLRPCGVFVQDKWTPHRKLTLNLGLRFETTYGWINDGEPLCQEETIFIAGQCFAGGQRRPRLEELRAAGLGDLRPVRETAGRR